MEGHSGNLCLFFARLGVGNDWAEFFGRISIRMAMATGSEIGYFKNLALENLMRDAEYIADVLSKREED